MQVKAFSCGRLNETNLKRKIDELNKFLLTVDVVNVFTAQDGENSAIIFVSYNDKTSQPKTAKKAE